MSITSKGRAALSRLIGAGELIEATPTLCTLGLDLDDQACRLPFRVPIHGVISPSCGAREYQL
jgi:hypothetical protein